MPVKHFPRLALLLAFCTLVCWPRLAAGAAEPGAKGVEELLNRAGVSFAKGNREEAVELATRAIEMEPKNAKAYYVRGRFYAEVRQPQKAVKDLNQALVLDPRLGLAYYHRAAEDFKLGRIKESAADFDKFVDLAPDTGPCRPHPTAGACCVGARPPLVAYNGGCRGRTWRGSSNFIRPSTAMTSKTRCGIFFASRAARESRRRAPRF